MAKRKTSLEFSEAVIPLLNHWEKRLGLDLRDIINAGIVLFDAATAEQREQALIRANSASKEDFAHLPEDEFRRRVLQIVKDSQGILEEKKRGKKAKPSKAG
jgi:hypothetical protein